MYKMDRVFSFHISQEERSSIEILKQNDINISKFLRRSLRDQAEKMSCQRDGEQEIGNNGGLGYDKTKKTKLYAKKRYVQFNIG